MALKATILRVISFVKWLAASERLELLPADPPPGRRSGGRTFLGRLLLAESLPVEDAPQAAAPKTPGFLAALFSRDSLDDVPGAAEPQAAAPGGPGFLAYLVSRESLNDVPGAGGRPVDGRGKTASGSKVKERNGTY